MTRPYGVKGRKRKHAQPKHDAQHEQEQVQPQPKKPLLDNEESNKAMSENEEPEPTRPLSEVNELSGIPIAPSEINANKPNVIFILEKASLEVAKVGKVLLLFNFSLPLSSLP